MGRPIKDFLHLLTNPNGSCYAIDNTGKLITQPTTWLTRDPKEWRDQTLQWGRNATYFGLNRTFTAAYSFIEDGAAILRNIMYTIGLEAQVSLVVLKWNSDTDVYEDYYKAEIDLSQFVDSVETDFKVNLLEGGLVKLLKSYENTMFSIPMDGSLAQHYRINDDGILFDAIYHYEFVPIIIPTDHGALKDVWTIPIVFMGAEGDSAGVIHGDQNLDNIYTYAGRLLFGDDLTGDENVLKNDYIISFDKATNVRMKGSVTVRGDTLIANEPSLQFVWATDLKGVDHTTDGGPGPFNFLRTFRREPMIPAVSDLNRINIDTHIPLPNFPDAITVHRNEERTFFFDTEVDLQPNEKLSIVGTFGKTDAAGEIIGGSIDLSFSTRANASRPWCLSAYDTLGILIDNICKYASEADGRTYNYGFKSDLLKQFLGFSLTSGDALRASADPNFQQYFNPATPDTGGTTNVINNYTGFGPTMKTSLKEFFTAMNAILNASMGTEYDSNGNFVVFLEEKKYVFNSDTVDLNLGEISNMKVSLAEEYIFDIINVGYAPQQYDETSGKWEYNTTLHMRSPIKKVQKTLDLVCPYRADSYGIEFTRFNNRTQSNSKSTTYNNSDQSVFLLNADINSKQFDSGVITTPVIDGDLQGVPGAVLAELALTKETVGTYWQPHKDNGVFQVRAPLNLQVHTFHFTYAGNLLGVVGDHATFDFVYNGVVLHTVTYTVTGPGNFVGGGPGGQSFTLPVSLSQGDVFYWRITSPGTCQVVLNDVTKFDIDGSFFTGVIQGTSTYPPGSYHALIVYDLCTPDVNLPATPIDTGFSYLTFNESILHKNFDWLIQIVSAAAGNGQLKFDLYMQGRNVWTVTHNAVAGGAIYGDVFSGNLNFDFGDVVFLKYSQTASLAQAGIQGGLLTITSTAILVYQLARENYDAISGIPNPATAYNIKDLTPHRMALRHGNYIRGALFQQQTKSLKFLSLDKNPILNTTIGNKVIQEMSDIEIDTLDNPLFYPYIFEFDTQVPEFFATLMTNAVNKHIEFTCDNVQFFGFPVKCSVKPGLNESQTWQLLASPKNKLTDLIDLSINGINYLQLMAFGVTVPRLNPVQFVPMTAVIDPRYNSRNMDQDWYINQISRWSSKRNYFQKWQTNDTISFQLWANAFGPATISFIDCNGKAVLGMTGLAMTKINDPAVKAPYIAYQISIPLNTLGAGTYYMIATIGDGSVITQMISEGLDVKVMHADTVLCEYKNTKNKQTVVFTNGFAPSIRVEGCILRMVPGMNLSAYEDEPAEEFIIDGIPYRKFTLQLGSDGTPVPPWVVDKMNRIMGLNTTIFDGVQMSRNGDVSFEPVSFPGEALQYWNIEVRQTKNDEQSTLTPDGALETNLFAVYNLDTKSFGDLSSQVSSNIVQVEHTDF